MNASLSSACGPQPRWRQRADAYATHATVALAFALPVSTAAANVCLVVALAAWAVSGQWRPALRASVASAPALLALTLMGWLAVSTLWTSAPTGDVLAFARKYADLALVGLFAFLLREPQARARVLAAFAAAMLLTLALSCAAAAGLLPDARWLKAAPGNAVVFKLHITHGLLMALAALLFAHHASQAGHPALRAAGWALCALAAANVLLMIDGRTGYVVLAAFVLLAARLRYGRIGAALAIVAVLVAGITAYQSSQGLRARVDLAVTEARAWDPARAAGINDSIGSRLEFLSGGVALARERPFAGHGLGAFPSAYRDHVAGSDRMAAQHPHNEYLLLAIQAGLPAAALFAWLLVRLYGSGAPLAGSRRAFTPGASAEALLAPALAIWMAVGCLFNSLLIDHTESLLFTLLAGVVAAALSDPARTAASTPPTDTARP